MVRGVFETFEFGSFETGKGSPAMMWGNSAGSEFLSIDDRFDTTIPDGYTP